MHSLVLRWLAAAAALMLPWVAGCRREGCLGGDDVTCSVPSPCPKLAFTCAGGSAQVKEIVAGDTLPGGLDALGAIGDVRLQNEQVVAVIDGLANANYVAPSGGMLLDLAVRVADNDGLNQVFHVTGILPGDAVRYTKGPELVTGDGSFAAVQLRGQLDGHPNVRVATRYEVRACEPGIRIRTEIVNLEPDPALWSVSDAFYWSGREALPFVPLAGQGFSHPPFDLLTINDTYRRFPFFAASTHTAGSASASYAVIACNAPTLEGVHSDIVSTAGRDRRIVMPRDFEVYERFVAVARGNDVAPAADVALEVRRQLFGEAFATISGRVVRTGGTPVGGDEHKAAVIVREDKGGGPQAQVPWTQVVPGADGRFAARVPAGRSYLLEVNAFGRALPDPNTVAVQADTAVGDLTVPMVGQVELRTDVRPGGAAEALVIAHPADDATRDATSGRLFGAFARCTPFLGPPNGPSPACNRILVNGTASVEFPAGNYHLYATIGPFATIERQTIAVTPGSTQQVRFQLQRLAVAPAGSLSADLHVHGGPSFDSSLPDRDRVLAFLAASMDVIAATDHDVVHTYERGVSDLGAQGRLAILPGLETTGHILWMKVPGSSVPRVIGHWNFWPLRYDASMPRRGAPNDESVEPGELFTRVEPLFTAKGIRQLNHPWADADFGRDLGFPRAVGLDATRPMPTTDDGTGAGILVRTPPGAKSNLAYDSQEVMNGTENSFFLPYRAVWFHYLNNGIVKAGTANSDSHSLTDNILGTPRNVVTAAAKVADFQGGGFTNAVNTFNDAIRAGRVIGTNGPIIEVTTKAADGSTRSPGVEPFKPASPLVLTLTVSAAPWVPVDEVRIYVNGKEAKKLEKELAPFADPFGANPAPIARYTGTVTLDEATFPAGVDSWVVVEAGAPLVVTGDLCVDGIPDTSDNTGDGKVDDADVDRTKDATAKCGPLNNPPEPAATDPKHHFAAVTPRGYPLAFTNPFVLDRNGDGRYSGPGVPAGGNPP